MRDGNAFSYSGLCGTSIGDLSRGVEGIGIGFSTRVFSFKGLAREVATKHVKFFFCLGFKVGFMMCFVKQQNLFLP